MVKLAARFNPEDKSEMAAKGDNPIPAGIVYCTTRAQCERLA